MNLGSNYNRSCDLKSCYNFSKSNWKQPFLNYMNFSNIPMQKNDSIVLISFNKKRFWNGENIQQNKNSEKPSEIISTSGSLSIDEQCWPPWRGQPRHSDAFCPFFVRPVWFFHVLRTRGLILPRNELLCQFFGGHR